MRCKRCGKKLMKKRHQLVPLREPPSLRESENYLNKMWEWEENTRETEEYDREVLDPLTLLQQPLSLLNISDKYIKAINGARRMRENGLENRQRYQDWQPKEWTKYLGWWWKHSHVHYQDLPTYNEYRPAR